MLFMIAKVFVITGILDEAHGRLIFDQTIQRKVEKGVKIRILQLVILIKR